MAMQQPEPLAASMCGSKPVLLWRPVSVEEAWECRRNYGSSATYMAGGSWLRPRWEEAVAPVPEHVVSLDRIQTLGSIRLQQDGTVTVGAMVRLAEALHNDMIRELCPLLHEAVASMALPAIRNQATIGGNVMTVDGDLVPALLALDAAVLVFDGRRTDRIPLMEWLWLSVRPPELLLVGLKLPVVPEGARVFYVRRKLGTFTPTASSTATPTPFTAAEAVVAGWMVPGEGGSIEELRVAVGGTRIRPTRLKRTERLFTGGTLLEGAAAVQLAVAQELTEPRLKDEAAGTDTRFWILETIADQLLLQAKANDGLPR